MFNNKKISIREAKADQLIRRDMMHSEISSGDKGERDFAFSDLKLADRIDGSIWWERAGDFYGLWNFNRCTENEVHIVSRTANTEQLSSRN